MDELIEENMGLVISIVETFRPRNHTEREDLIDAGRIGLWKALQKHEENLGSISTYAWRPIKWAIIKEIRNKRSSVSLEKVPEPTVSEEQPVWETLVDNLSSEELDIIEMRRQGYKFREISNVIGGTASTIKNKFYRTIKKLQEANA